MLCGCGWNRGDRLALAHAQQVVFAHIQPVTRVSVAAPTAIATRASCADAHGWTTPARSSGSRRVNYIGSARLAAIETVEAGRKPGPASPCDRLVHFRSSLPLDLLVDGGFPVNASIRCSSMRCKHLFKSISRACWPILPQLCNAPLGPALLAVAGKHVAWSFANLTPPAMQHVRVHLQRPCYLTHRTSFQPLHRGQRNSFVKVLLDNPTTQFSFG